MHHVVSSNRMENLAGALVESLRQPLVSPFQKEVILVHSRGIQRWISLQLAGAFGISANVDFPFPVPYLTDLMVESLPDWGPEEGRVFHPEVLTWSLMGLVDQDRGGEKGPVGYYLAGGGAERELKKYQLAKRLGSLLDRYGTYRPDLLKRWEAGRTRNRDEAWQAGLWTGLLEKHGPHHRIPLREAYIDLLRKGDRTVLNGLPERLSVFGISSLAPFFVELLQEIGKKIDVHFYFLNPSRMYWGDIRSSRQRARTRKKTNPDQLELGFELAPEMENELLASWGKPGKDFFNSLLEVEGMEAEYFSDPGRGTVLRGLQADVLNLTNGSGTPDWEKEKEGQSLSLHSCHSRRRQVQVAQDLILDAFEKLPGLKPRDVIVMAPRIEDFSAMIRTVFDRPAEEARSIPFSIADHAFRENDQLPECLLDILALSQSRITASEVVGILENEGVARRYKLEGRHLERIRQWLGDVSIHWGWDGAFKESLGLPADSQHTWEFGLERLILGWAMPTGGEQLFSGILPYDEIEGEACEILSRFLEFFSCLKAVVLSLETKRSVGEWVDLVRRMLDDFFLEGEEDGAGRGPLTEILTDLQDSVTLAGFDELVGVEVIQAHLRTALDAIKPEQGFFTGGMTFCSLRPMRSLPFRVVVLMGMEGTAFPRRETQMDFDLMKREPRPGDRLGPDEDRYLFLEALLSARDRMALLYTGQSDVDNSELNPSSVINQLVRYIEKSYGPAWKQGHCFRHRLQPFHRQYFEADGRYFSYATELAEASRRESAGGLLPSLADFGELAPVEDWPEELPFEELVRFVQRPVAGFFRNRFRLLPPWEHCTVEDREPIDLDPLELWKVEDRMVDLLSRGLPPRQLVNILMASGELPQSETGRHEAEVLQEEVSRYLNRIQEVRGGAMETERTIDVEIVGFRMTGTVGHLYNGEHVRARLGSLRPQDRLLFFLEHLLLQLGGHGPTPSYFVPQKGSGWKIPPVSERDARRHLATYVATYQKGMNRPLPFMLRSSWVFAQELQRKGKEWDAFQKAMGEWEGGPGRRAEREDFYHRLVFRQRQLRDLGSDFISLASSVYLPVLQHLKKAS
ncbi:MAG: exodeoxyribonuclease V subunit gamma [Verrucomicrobiota bacterium]